MSFFSQKINFFMTVARFKSLKKASIELGLSISLLSKGISSLEDQLSLQLFLRKSEGMILTHDGESLYAKLIHEYDKINNIYSSLFAETSFNAAFHGLPVTLMSHLLESLNQEKKFKSFHLKQECKEVIENNNSQYDVIYTCEKLNINKDCFFWTDTLSVLSSEKTISQKKPLNLIQSKEFSRTEVFKKHMMYLNRKNISYSLSIIDDFSLRLTLIDKWKANSLIPTSLIKSASNDRLNTISFPENLPFNHYLYCDERPFSTTKSIEGILKKNNIKWNFIKALDKR